MLERSYITDRITAVLYPFVTLVPERPDVEPAAERIDRHMPHRQIGIAVMLRIPQDEIDTAAIRTVRNLTEFPSEDIVSARKGVTRLPRNRIELFHHANTLLSAEFRLVQMVGSHGKPSVKADKTVVSQ